MKYKKKFFKERVPEFRHLVLERQNVEAGLYEYCCSLGVPKPDIRIDIPKGEIVDVRREEYGYFFMRILGKRTFISIDEFAKIKTLQFGDLVQLAKGQIGTVTAIYSVGYIEIKGRQGTIENPGKYDGKELKTGIDDISVVASP